MYQSRKHSGKSRPFWTGRRIASRYLFLCFYLHPKWHWRGTICRGTIYLFFFCFCSIFYLLVFMANSSGSGYELQLVSCEARYERQLGRLCLTNRQLLWQPDNWLLQSASAATELGAGALAVPLSQLLPSAGLTASQLRFSLVGGHQLSFHVAPAAHAQAQRLCSRLQQLLRLEQPQPAQPTRSHSPHTHSPAQQPDQDTAVPQSPSAAAQAPDMLADWASADDYAAVLPPPSPRAASTSAAWAHAPATPLSALPVESPPTSPTSKTAGRLHSLALAGSPAASPAGSPARSQVLGSTPRTPSALPATPAHRGLSIDSQSMQSGGSSDENRSRTGTLRSNDDTASLASPARHQQPIQRVGGDEAGPSHASGDFTHTLGDLLVHLSLIQDKLGSALSRPLLMAAPEWDGELPECTVCGAKFSRTRRRHHCRMCGSSVCSSCSPHMYSVPFLVVGGRV